MFKFNLSSELLAMINAEQVEVMRLYALTDRWLGEALLQLARAARRASPHLRPEDFVYDNVFVFHVIPELAYRLGCRQFLPGERDYDYEISNATDAWLRDRAMGCLHNISVSSYWRKTAWMMLLREPANGNPVCFAMDRISPGSLDQPDFLVKRLSEIAANRQVKFTGVWDPEMIGSPEQASADDTSVSAPQG